MVNQGKAKFKQSKIEKMVNKLVVLLVILELLWCLIMAVMHGCFIRDKAAFMPELGRNKVEYIYYSGNTDPERGEVPEHSYSATKEALTMYVGFFILLNTLIPISLIVTLEIVKTIQSKFIQHDSEMICPDTGL